LVVIDRDQGIGVQGGLNVAHLERDPTHELSP
jgi:hypothetical protein